ncbi:unnamed protein product [Gongylonema pulchrum]|uniref:DUF2807 domain-containing protein n=1 Tax=Gongylonema pulchrum TaxID=637853 RepID=A0A183ELR2_9BILA|nr:unnamed protein product [Gongylonema pulchrum]
MVLLILSYYLSSFTLGIDGHWLFTHLVISPVTNGKTTLEFTDLCIGNSFSATVSVTDVEEIIIEAPEFIALNSQQQVELKIRDVEGSFFITDDADIMNAQLNASSSAISITRINALNYVLQGNEVGVTTLRASALRANGRLLQSKSHGVQVFAQLQLQPKLVTLIPDAVFQLEVFGGPQPLPPVHYRLNDTSIAAIAQNGLITSKKIGYTKVVGSVGLDGNASIEDYAIVKTVTLAGIRIRISTTRIEVGEKAWARVDGLAHDETPFSFGGALYPLKFSWSTTTPGIIQIASPLDVHIITFYAFCAV